VKKHGQEKPSSRGGEDEQHTTGEWAEGWLAKTAEAAGWTVSWIGAVNPLESGSSGTGSAGYNTWLSDDTGYIRAGNNRGLRMLLDTSPHRFPELPIYVTSLTIADDARGRGLTQGESFLAGGAGVYEPFADKFTFYLDRVPAHALAVAVHQGWAVNYIAYIPTKAQISRLQEGREGVAKAIAAGKVHSGNVRKGKGGAEEGGGAMLALVFDLSMARSLKASAARVSTASTAEDDLRGWESIVAESVSGHGAHTRETASQDASASSSSASPPSAAHDPLDDPPWVLLRMAIADSLSMDSIARSTNDNNGGFDSLSVPVLVRRVCKIEAASELASSVDLSFAQDSLGVRMEVAIVFTSSAASSSAASSKMHFALAERRTALSQLKGVGFNGFLARQLREHGVSGLTAADLVIARPRETTVQARDWMESAQKEGRAGSTVSPLRCPTEGNLGSGVAGSGEGMLDGEQQEEEHAKRAAMAGVAAAATTLATDLGFRVRPYSGSDSSMLDPRLRGPADSAGPTASGSTIALTRVQAIGLLVCISIAVAALTACTLHAGINAVHRLGRKDDEDPLFPEHEMSPMAPREYGGGYAGTPMVEEPTGTDYHF
jgi:hypothetical protein